MNNLIEYDFSRFTILFFIFLSIVLFAFLQLLKAILPRLLKRKSIKLNLLKHYSTFELLMWVIFLFWSLPYFYRKNIYYATGLTLIVFIIIIWIGWYALRDITCGFIARSNSALLVGNKIIFNQQILTITKLDATQVTGRFENGNIIFIKYCKLISSEFQQVVEHEITHNKTIDLTVAKTEKYDDLTKSINSFLLTQPNYAIKHQPEISKTAESDMEVSFRITIYALNSNNIFDIEQALIKKFKTI